MNCGFCRNCIQELDDAGKFPKVMEIIPALMQVFVVCLICGNKRCPKATNHDLQCTNSNEPGQEGSDYQ